MEWIAILILAGILVWHDARISKATRSNSQLLEMRVREMFHDHLIEMQEEFALTRKERDKFE